MDHLKNMQLWGNIIKKILRKKDIKQKIISKIAAEFLSNPDEESFMKAIASGKVQLTPNEANGKDGYHLHLLKPE